MCYSSLTTYELHQKLLAQLSKRSNDAVLPVQIAYFTGLRFGEVSGLTWQDINLDEQNLTVRRSVRYNSTNTAFSIGGFIIGTTTKKSKRKTGYFMNTTI